MPIAELEQMIATLPKESYDIVVQLVTFLSSKRNEEEQSHTRDISNRFGVARGQLSVPDDIDFCNDEVAALFGV